MPIIEWFRVARTKGGAGHGDTDTVRRMADELDRLEPSRARHLAAFAYVLSRVAAADLDVSREETETMVEILQRVGRLPEAHAALVVEIAKEQNRLFGGTEDFLVTREFRAIASETERRELLNCLFAVSAADHAISAEEDAKIRQIASELGFSHTEYVAVRLAYSDMRSVFRRDDG